MIPGCSSWLKEQEVQDDIHLLLSAFSPKLTFRKILFPYCFCAKHSSFLISFLLHNLNDKCQWWSILPYSYHRCMLTTKDPLSMQLLGSNWAISMFWVKLTLLTAEDLLFILDVACWAILAWDRWIEQSLEVLKRKEYHFSHVWIMETWFKASYHWML